MSARQQTAPAAAAILRRHVLPTRLGPCVVRVQEPRGDAEPASGTADVFLHGAAGSWTTFLPLLERAPDRARVLIDLPGWGESTAGSRPAHFSIGAVAAAVTEVLDGLGYRRWHLVGHSMGGFLALHLAAALPERTASVAAISATTFGVAGAARRPLRRLAGFPAFVGMLLLMRTMAALGPAGTGLVRAVGNTFVMGPLMSPFFADPSTVSARVLRGLGEDARPAGFSAAARAVADYDFEWWRTIRCPVLATRGDRDVFTPAADLDRLAAIVPHARAVTIPRCGHFAIMERPEHVHRLLRDLRTRSRNTRSGWPIAP